MTSQPTLLLTRPMALSTRVAKMVRSELPQAEIVVSPVMKIEPANPVPDLAGYDAVIVTSQSAAPFLPDLMGKPCYVVGEKTAKAVRQKNGEIATVFETAKDLLAGKVVARRMLVIRGEHAQGDVSKLMNLAGIDTDEVVAYRQVATALSQEARQLLSSEVPVVLPLYSPRSARLLADQLDQVGPNLRAIAMSSAVADEWRKIATPSVCVLDAPTSENMHGKILSLLRR